MHFSYPTELPVSQRREEIVAAIIAHQVLVVVGDTGSGKTTQLPKMCLEAGRGVDGRVGCTQPRRIAALSVADRVAEELRAPEVVGAKIRFHDRTSETTRIKFMTDGILLAETRQDPLLRQYDTLIVDEAHERSLNIDFLLGYIKKLLSQRPDLKLLISSATIDARQFSRHFQEAPVLAVSGRTHPITTLYRQVPDDEESDQSYVDQTVAEVEALASQPLGGDILVFMPTERDIADTLDGLQHLADRLLLLPLYGRLPAGEQRKVFQPAPRRKVIVATNVAETSITVPGIRFVIDTGLARISRYNPRTGTTSLKVSRISQASCEQRRGRCGRTGPGVCIRLYSEEDFSRREPFTPPEIQRANLAEVLLQMIDLNLGNPMHFPFIDPPAGTAIREGYKLLKELGALTGENHLTANGRLMARLPLDPRISRMIIESETLGVSGDVTILAAALSIQDPRIRPPDKEAKADEAHRRFLNPTSDFLTLLNIWNGFFNAGEEAPTKSRLSRFCTANFLSWQRMREWMDVHEQIHRQLRLNRQPLPQLATNPEAVHMALTSGFLRNICQKKEKNNYLAAGNKEVVLFPGSVLYNKGPQWVVAAEFVETSQLFARTVAAIQPDWLERLGGPLCKYSWSEPHWEKRSGRVIALERVSLFGLLIVAGRKVEYGRINERNRAEAREIFIRSALVDNQLGGHFPFLEHNVALVARFEELEERIRRRDIVVDPEVLFQFYQARLSDKVYDRFTLNRMLRRRKDDSFLRMTEVDICRVVPDDEELYRFPATIQTQGVELALSYLFDPGHAADGVTVQIPRDLLSQLNPQIFEWLVPGLLPEKLYLLCKHLPKQLRRRLVPLPDTVDRLMDGLTLYRGSLYQEVERCLLRVHQLTVQRGDWQIEALPLHLRMRFVLVDDQGRELTTSRSFNDLITWQQACRPALPKTGLATPPAERAITVEDLDTLVGQWPRTDAQGRVIGFLFAALANTEADGPVLLGYLDDPVKAQQVNRRGLQALYIQQCSKEITQLRRLCKDAVTNHSASWLSLGSKSSALELRNDLLGFILDHLFATGDGTLPSRAQFQDTLDRAKHLGVVRTGTALLKQVMDLLRLRRTVREKIGEWARRAHANRSFEETRHAAYLAAMERLVPADYLRTLRPDQLEHTPRYLQALALRIERAEHDPHKDSKKAERLRTPEARLTQLARFNNPTSLCLNYQRQYLELLEEFRVSLFAPELGTAQPVSEQRLLRKWQEVEQICRRVE